MNGGSDKRCTAFLGECRIASGGIGEVALAVKTLIDRGERTPILIFDDGTGRPVDIDFRGTAKEVSRRLEPAAADAMPISPVEADAPRRPGRPKLGVVAREVTLLPRHWDWLNKQPGGASVALRKLVEAARRMNAPVDRILEAQEAAYHFTSAMAGNLPGFEEAARALFAGKRERFEALIEPWPTDIRDHAHRLATDAFAGSVEARHGGRASQDDEGGIA